jgi:drug/metabolite transporter (DMT)-like permease
VPVLTTLLAVALGSERISFRRRDGWAKLLGAALVVAGALVTGAARPAARAASPRSRPSRRRAAQPVGGSVPAVGAAAAAEARRRQLGFWCLVGNCSCMACYLTVQESLLARYPRPMRITLLSYAFGAAMLVAALVAGADGGLQAPGRVGRCRRTRVSPSSTPASLPAASTTCSLPGGTSS